MLAPLVVPLVSLVTRPFPERHLARVFGPDTDRPKGLVLEKNKAYSAGR